MLYSKNNLEHGYANKILSIDLGKDDIRVEDLDPVVRDYFLGGRGLGLYLLYRHISPTTRAADPENPLILSPGPLGGVPQFPGTAKCMAISLFPKLQPPPRFLSPVKKAVPRPGFWSRA